MLGVYEYEVMIDEQQAHGKGLKSKRELALIKPWAIFQEVSIYCCIEALAGV